MPPMLHVWITDHPCGPFAGLEGHGGSCVQDHDHDSHDQGTGGGSQGEATQTFARCMGDHGFALPESGTRASAGPNPLSGALDGQDPQLRAAIEQCRAALGG
jgi:hypothetical protein